ncbi:MAG: hypothetical protein R6U57_00355 [Anaerolineales bacterium]
MEPVTIQKASTEQEKRSFLSLPWKVYQGNPYWVPPIFSERMDFLNPEKNPFYNHADVELFTALRGKDVVGTIAAFTNRRHNEYQGENIGWFGFFEVLEDPEAAAVLLETAEDWARERGHTAIRGPAQFDTNEECGLLVDGFDDSPRILMTYNPPYYVDYLEENGYKKAMDLWAYKLAIQKFKEESSQRLDQLAERILDRRKITVRNINMREFDAEVERVKGLYNSAWSKNWGFVPMDDAEFDHLAEQLHDIIDPDLVYIAEREGQPVGFGLTLLDLNKPLRLAYPTPNGPEWWMMAKLIWHWKILGRVDWVRVFALGVIDQYRSLGIDAILYHKTAKAAIRKGIKYGEMSWILESNTEMNKPIRAMGGEIYKTYRFYEKDL